MRKFKCSCIFNHFGIFAMKNLIPFEKIFENSAEVISLLVKQLITVLTSRTRHYMFSEDFVN